MRSRNFSIVYCPAPSLRERCRSAPRATRSSALTRASACRAQSAVGVLIVSGSVFHSGKRALQIAGIKRAADTRDDRGRIAAVGRMRRPHVDQASARSAQAVDRAGRLREPSVSGRSRRSAASKPARSSASVGEAGFGIAAQAARPHLRVDRRDFSAPQARSENGRPESSAASSASAATAGASAAARSIFWLVASSLPSIAATRSSPALHRPVSRAHRSVPTADRALREAARARSPGSPRRPERRSAARRPLPSSFASCVSSSAAEPSPPPACSSAATRS